MFLILISMLIFMIGLFSTFFWSSSFLNILVSFEIVMFSIYLLLLLIFGLSGMVEILVFLVFSVCEAVLGLVILLLKLYFYGKDNMLMNFM